MFEVSPNPDSNPNMYVALNPAFTRYKDRVRSIFFIFVDFIQIQIFKSRICGKQAGDGPSWYLLCAEWTRPDQQFFSGDLLLFSVYR
jgi:hypothetical protein